ncbi:hypothetical protein V490_05192 [Pseudogymnoascus sp. VKM F-3557]|nr:hypothetical protein V490_05192 [Pseudogymnoascus sp. VKM F-3557]
MSERVIGVERPTWLKFSSRIVPSRTFKVWLVRQSDTLVFLVLLATAKKGQIIARELLGIGRGLWATVAIWPWKSVFQHSDLLVPVLAHGLGGGALIYAATEVKDNGNFMLFVLQQADYRPKKTF